MIIAGIGFSTIGKSINSSLNHSSLEEVVSRAVSSASMVDFVSIVCLQDLQETAPPPNVNIYPLVAFSSSASIIQFESLYPSSTPGTLNNEFHNSLYPSDSALPDQYHQRSSPGLEVNLLNLLTANEMSGWVALARYIREPMI